MQMTTSQTLDNIFGAQGTLEEAANEMAAAVGAYPELAPEFRDLLAAAASSGVQPDASAQTAVNRSGYRVSTPAEAAELCGELLALFEQAMAGP